MRQAFALSLLLTTAACAAGGGSQQMAAPQDDQQAKQFASPGPNRGALYIYRSGGLMGFVRPIDVQIAGGSNASLPRNTYVLLEGPPGPVEVDCKIGDNQNSAQIDIADGRTRYVEVSMTAGLWSGGCQLAEVAPEVGRAGVIGGRRVQQQQQ